MFSRICSARAVRPGKLEMYLAGLDRASRRNLLAALRNCTISAESIRWALLSEGFRIARTTVAIFRRELKLGLIEVAA